MKVQMVILMFVGLPALPVARAHFIWVGFDQAPPMDRARIYFGENATPDQADYLQRLPGLKVWTRHGTDQRPVSTKLETDEDYGWLAIESNGANSVEASCLYGVFQRREKALLMNYYAKATRLVRGVSCPPSPLLDLDIEGQVINERWRLTVRWKGTPAEACQVVAKLPNGQRFEGDTDSSGSVVIGKATPGTYEIRARMIVENPGKHKDEPYDEIRHYSTLTFDMPK